MRSGACSIDEANRRLNEIETFRPPNRVPELGVAHAAYGAGFPVLLSSASRALRLLRAQHRLDTIAWCLEEHD